MLKITHFDKITIDTMGIQHQHTSFVSKVINRYCEVSDRAIAQLFSIANIQELKKGSILLEAGKISKQLSILYRGTIVSSFENAEGQIYHKNIFSEKDFVGSMVSAMTQKPSEFSLTVIEDAVLVNFDYVPYRNLINTDAELKNFYIAYLEKNWVLDKEKRELDIILKDAEERYLDFIKCKPGIETRIPLRYIASHLGITPTQLSRIRKKIKN
ncbi:MAG: Crp/Fnr family transcriptional regulator [Flavicella sp.]